jgi:hypothetical protein
MQWTKDQDPYTPTGLRYEIGRALKCDMRLMTAPRETKAR